MNNPDQPYYLREIARESKSQLNSVRREINILRKIGIIKSAELSAAEIVGLKTARDKLGKKRKIKPQGSKKYFMTNENFLLYPELKALLIKAQLLLEKSFVKKIKTMPRIKLFVLTGIFVGYDNFKTDMLIVGQVDKHKISSLVKKFERDLGRPLNYTIMTYPEFKYRQDITDRFMFDILEGSKIVIVDKLNES